MYRQHYPDDPGMHNMPEYGNVRVTYPHRPTFMERVKQSCVAVAVGMALILAGAGLLFWNEGRAVQTARSLDEGLQQVLPLQTIDVIFDENNGKLVHVTGPLQTSKVLYDELYGVAVQAVKLKRDVEMYQWVEHEEKKEIDDGHGEKRTETRYSYTKEWRSHVIRSGSFYNKFGHENLDAMPVEPKDYEAEDTRVGHFYLSTGLLSKVSNYKQLQKLPMSKDPRVQVYHDSYYHGINPAYPQIGDLKVAFKYAGLSGRDVSSIGPPDMVSLVAKQRRNELVAYQTEAGDELELLYMGEHSAQDMFMKEKMQNTMITWGVRFGGWLLLFVAFGCLTQIVVTLVDWIPLVRDLVAMGMMALNMTLSICLSLTVIALGWIRYRPWLGISILACAAIPFVVARMKTRRRTSREL